MAGVSRPGAAFPKPICDASTPFSSATDAPELVEWMTKPFAITQNSPSRPGTATTMPGAGPQRPLAIGRPPALALKLRAPSVLTTRVPASVS